VALISGQVVGRKVSAVVATHQQRHNKALAPDRHYSAAVSLVFLASLWRFPAAGELVVSARDVAVAKHSPEVAVVMLPLD